MERRKKLGFWAQVALIFFTVSGGSYGLEALVGEVGVKWTLALTVLMPFLWALPIALMVAELSSALPEQGGFYVWVRRGLGPFWGFQEGWWTLCYCAADMALYPVLFVKYLGFFFPSLAADTWSAFCTRWSICLVFIGGAVLSNLRGSANVGKHAIINFVLVSMPFVLLTLWSTVAGDWGAVWHSLASAPAEPVTAPAFAAGLAIILWNYCGWDNVSTYANEVENPHRNYPRALATSLIIVTSFYILTLLAGFSATLDLQDWHQGSGWPSIAEKLGGKWLGSFVALAAVVSTWAMFNSQVLYVSRLPAAMAKDGWLPEFLAKECPHTGTPTYSVLSVATVAALFSSLSLEKLMVVDILFYALALSLEFATLIALRIRRPDLERPFRVPFGVLGLFLMSLPPVAMIFIIGIFSAWGEEGSLLQVGIVALGIFSGCLLYWKRQHSWLAARAPLGVEKRLAQ